MVAVVHRQTGQRAGVAGGEVRSTGMDGWCVNVGMDDLAAVRTGKTGGESAGGGCGGGSRAAAASSQNQPKRNLSFLFTEMCFLPARARFRLLHFFPVLRELFFFFAFVQKRPNCPISEECDFNMSVSLSVWRRGFSAEVARVHHETVDCV